MPITRSLLDPAQKIALQKHLLQHKVYPYRYRMRAAINETNFATADSTIGHYFTRQFTPQFATGIVSIAAGFIITPNTTTGIFALVGSYRSTLTMADLAGNTPDEGAEIYSLISNGGAINDFQVFFPLNWYVEAGKTFYIHAWADETTIDAGTSTLTGHFTLGTLVTDQG